MLNLLILILELLPLGIVAIVAAKHEDELIEWEDRQIAKLRRKGHNE